MAVSTVSTGVLACFDCPDESDTRAAKEWARTRWRSALFTPAEVVAAAAPWPTMPKGVDNCGIYFLIRAGRNCYVGMARSITSRLHQHRSDGRPFDAVAVIAGLPRLWIREFESAYLAAWQPPWNMAPADGHADWLPEMIAMLAAMPRDGYICGEPELAAMTEAEILELVAKLG